jgi:hypothetical protein
MIRQIDHRWGGYEEHKETSSDSSATQKLDPAFNEPSIWARPPLGTMCESVSSRAVADSRRFNAFLVSGENVFLVNPGVFTDHLNRQLRSDISFEATQVRGKVLCINDDVRGANEFAAAA